MYEMSTHHCLLKEHMSALTDRFESICARIETATARAGRNPGSVRLVAVSKRHGAEAVAELAVYWSEQYRQKATLLPPVFGESYVQEAEEKMRQVAGLLSATGTDAPEWHFIGHVQSRKAREVAGFFSCIHSVDSLKLARNLHKYLEESGGTGQDRGQNILVQVNIGREPQKSGVAPEDVEPLLLDLAALPLLRAGGLMCLPPLSGDPGETVKHFEALRLLRDTARENTGLALPELSMGMSHDFEEAIQEGATIVRVGTDIFGPR